MNYSNKGSVAIKNQQGNTQQCDLIMDMFEKVRVLGRGAYGLCYLCKDKSTKPIRKVVIKMVSLECRSDAEKRIISHEAHLLKQLSHPNIIRLYSSFSEREQLHIVMEYIDGGTMEKMVEDRKGCRMGQDLVLYYFTQITLAVDFIHSKKIIHRDIKTQNIFLNREKTIVKVGDFGISKELNSKNEASTVIGTPNYLSPEICEGRAYGPKSDIWSMGCVLYELMELKKAYQGDSFPSIVLRITRGKYGPISPTVTDVMRKLIANLLEIDEQNRPTTKEIIMMPLVLQKWVEIHVNLGRIKPDILQCTKETYRNG